MRRWLVRLFLVSLVVVGVAAAGIIWLLQSDFAREQAERSLRDVTGMHVTVARARTTWGGATTLGPVSVGLTPDSEPFLTLRHVQAEHTSVMGLLTLRPFRARSVRIDGATLKLARDEQGEWNVQRAWRSLAASGGGSSGRTVVTIRNADVHWHDGGVNGLAIDLSPDAGAGWHMVVDGHWLGRVVATVREDQGAVAVEGLEARIGGTTVRGGARYSSRDRVLRAKGAWAYHVKDAPLHHRGEFEGGVDLAAPNYIRVDGKVTTSGQVERGGWSGTVAIDGEGPAWDTMAMHVAVTDGAWTPSGGESVPIDALATRLAIEWPRLRFDGLTVQCMGLKLTGDGVYDVGADEPLNAAATVAWTVAKSDDVVKSMQWQGRISGRDSMRGEGTLSVNGIMLRGRTLDAVQTNGSWRLELMRLFFKTGTFKMLDADCAVEGFVALDTRRGESTVRMTGLPIPRLASWLDSDADVGGTLDAEVHVAMPAERAEGYAVRIEASSQRPRWGGFSAEAATGAVAIRNGGMQIEPVRLTLGDGVVSGRATFAAVGDGEIGFAFDISRWPVSHALTGLSADLDGRVSGTLHLATKSPRMQFDLLTDVVKWGDVALGKTVVRGRIEGSAVTVEHFEAGVAGGVAHGSGQFDLTDVLKTRVTATLTDLDPQQAAGWQPALGQVRGQLSGAIRIEPAADPRALEPLQLTGYIASPAAVVGPLSVDRIDLAGFIGRHRIVLDQTTAHFADGEMGLYLSLTRREDRWYAMAQAFPRRLDLRKLREVLLPGRPAVEGRLSGTIRLTGPIDDLPGLNGRAEFRFEDADFADSLIFAPLLKQLSLIRRDDSPRGTGSASVRLDRSALIIDSFRYQHLNMDLYLDGQVEKLHFGVDSPMNLYVVATNRLLSRIDVPGLDELGRLLGSIRSSLTGVRVSGTVAQPRIVPATVTEVSRTIRNFLGAQTDGSP